MNISRRSPRAIRACTAAIIFTAVSCIGSSVLPAAEKISPPEHWTAKSAVQFALRNSPDSTIAARRIAAAQAAVEEADSAFHPRLNLSTQYGQTNNPMYSFGNILNQGNFSNDIDFNDPGRTDNLNLKAEVLYRLYNGGRDIASQQSAEAGYLASEHDRNVTEHQLGLAVVRAFQTIVQAQDQVAAREAELTAITASLEVAAARYEAGDLLKADLLTFEVQKARASENLIISRHQLELAEKVFLNLLGLEKGNVDLIQTTGNQLEKPAPQDYRQRPELATLTARLEALNAETERAKGARYPTIDGFASYQYDEGYVLDGSGDSWTAGLKLTYNLYDGQQIASRIARAEARRDELEARLAKLRLAVNLELQEAELNYQQAVERRSVTEKMVEVAWESAELSRVRFKEGVILSSDLIDTELRLTDALVRQSAAKANYRIAIAMLRRAAGLQQFAPTTKELLEGQP